MIPSLFSGVAANAMSTEPLMKSPALSPVHLSATKKPLRQMVPSIVFLSLHRPHAQSLSARTPNVFRRACAAKSFADCFLLPVIKNKYVPFINNVFF